MSLEVKKVKFSNKNVKKIYVDSFPKEERMPFLMMLLLTKITQTDFLAFYDQKVLCGFVYAATIENIAFIMFLAVDQCIRSKGYGSKILEEMQKIYSNNKIIISIERCDVEARNFYLKNGYIDTGYLIELSKIEQEVLIKNGTFDKDELFEFFIKYSNGSTKPKIWKR